MLLQLERSRSPGATAKPVNHRQFGGNVRIGLELQGRHTQPREEQAVHFLWLVWSSAWRNEMSTHFATFYCCWLVFLVGVWVLDGWCQRRRIHRCLDRIEEDLRVEMQRYGLRR